MFLETYTVSFFGHRKIMNIWKIEKRLTEIIRDLLMEKEYVEFLVGKNGDFDRVASSVIRRAKDACGTQNSTHVLVLPYMTAELRDNQKYYYKFYDEIEISTAAAGVHFKAAIQTRNREMADRSDLVLCYIENETGGAYETVRYAKKQGKTIINFAEKEGDEDAC